MNKLKTTIINYLINLSLLSITWGGLFRRSFNCDTIFHVIAQKEDIYTQIEDARYLCAGLDYLLYRMGINATDHTGVTILISLCILAAGVCLVQETFRHYLSLGAMWEKVKFLAITNLLFINVLFSEVLMFCECALAFALAYALAALGGYLFKRKKYIPVLIVMLCSVSFYQVGVVLGAILIAGIIFFDHFPYKEKLNINQIIIRGIIGGICTFGMGLLNMLSSRLLVWLGAIPELRKVPQTAGNGEKIKMVFSYFVALLKDSRSLLPSVWLPLLIIAVCVVVIVADTIKEKNWKRLFGILSFYVMMNVMIFIIPFMTKEVNTSPRIIFPFYTALSMLLLMTFQGTGSMGKKIIAGAGLFFFFIQIIISQMIISDHLLSNKLDILYANMAYHKIKDYEETTGTTVEYLAVTRDIDWSPFYQEIKYHTDQINERALGQVTNTLMNVMTEGDFIKLEMDEEIYNQYFKDKNWDYFDLDEQMIIVGNTAYWVIF